MIDHIGISVSNFKKSKTFYSTALAPVGVEIVMEVSAEQTGSRAYIGMGNQGKPFFWFGEGDKQPSPIHVAFSADSRAAVDAFYNAAIKAGGKDNGAPGIRPHYHPNYYGAFVIDPDGNNIEAVCHLPYEK